MQEQYQRWASPHLGREFDMLVFGKAGVPMVLFPTSRGRYYQYKDFKFLDVAAPYINDGLLKVYCPDSIDGESFYNYDIHPADRLKRHLAYDRLLLTEVFEKALSETMHRRLIVAGCSFGGYHAANLAFKYPHKVRYLVSMGGAFDIKQFIFGYYDDNAYFNNPPDYLPELKEEKYLKEIRRLGIVLGTGHLDSCRSDNLRLAQILTEKRIPHWLDDRPGVGHDWPWWKEMFGLYLQQIFEQQKAHLKIE